MKQPPEQTLRERALLLFIAGLFLLCSPSRLFWASEAMPWYTPYIIWLIIIGLTWYLYRWFKRHEL
jgi:hypothetical protein